MTHREERWGVIYDSLALTHTHTYVGIHTGTEMMEGGVTSNVRALQSSSHGRCAKAMCVLSNPSHCQHATLKCPGWLHWHFKSALNWTQAVYSSTSVVFFSKFTQQLFNQYTHLTVLIIYYNGEYITILHIFFSERSTSLALKADLDIPLCKYLFHCTASHCNMTDSRYSEV